MLDFKVKALESKKSTFQVKEADSYTLLYRQSILKLGFCAPIHQRISLG